MRLRISPQSNVVGAEVIGGIQAQASMRLRISPQSNPPRRDALHPAAERFNEAADFAAEQR